MKQHLGQIERALNPPDIANKAKESLSKTLGKKPYGVSAVSQNGGEWLAEVELIEEEHLISSFDVIGIYEAHLDPNGNLTGWNRKGFRKRE
jgi:hypothetical protein